MDAKHLSTRLLTVAKYVPIGARLADIGSDHAYLPAYLGLNDKISYAVAGEVVEGPYLNALHEIKKEDLAKKIMVRLADGLEAVNEKDAIDTITICGMGGPLICHILTEGKSKLENKPNLILQPNVGEWQVRKWLNENNYQILTEEIIDEDEHIYEIIVAAWKEERDRLTAEDYLFGPVLRKEKNSVFIRKWEQEQKKLQHILSEIQKAHQVPLEQKKALKNKIRKIGDVLNG
ncbi:tRNA (adenine(22)-N(1))-methyltransferase [Liquorilactobacillus uvarum]|uniref:tRNA (adenine(22)-N(1))-methyltransferase n=1 Tax=Liquorilactobacillus uvarum TaxID=303240 RepID=UPI00288C37D4|nr:tRNA (adenine(22)-N(1))-methyltransferase TrmK [Liquorilactobacillus uvarum]